ncbi:MAG: PfkB family carbohydrate kinase [Woeseia sp.]
MSVAVVGEALIDFMARDDGNYRPHFGGSPYNVAIGLVRQGVEVCYLSPLSDDTFGDQLAASLEREGVRTPITRRSRWPTSLSLVTVDARGLPSYRLYREGIADKDSTFEEIVANLPRDLDVFHTGSLAITPSQLPKIRKLFTVMKERGVLISVDINIRLGASYDTQAYLQGVRSLLPIADIVKASDEDLGAFHLHEDCRRSAEQIFAEMESGMLLLTEGRGGAVLYTSHGVVERKSYPIAQIADTVGAGDTFHSAFIASLCRHGLVREPLERASLAALGTAVDFACAAAAINVSRLGCSPPTCDEVYEFIAATQRGD